MKTLTGQSSELYISLHGLKLSESLSRSASIKVDINQFDAALEVNCEPHRNSWD